MEGLLACLLVGQRRETKRRAAHDDQVADPACKPSQPLAEIEECMEEHAGCMGFGRELPYLGPVWQIITLRHRE